MTRTVLLLLVLAGVLSALLALQLAPGPDPDADVPARPALPPAAAAPAAGTDAADDSLADPVRTILARPLFNPGRRPAAGAAGVAGTGADPPPRLAGVIVTPGGSRAIFAPAEGHPLVVPEGGQIGRFLVRAIAPGKVTLSDGGQQLVIRPSHARGNIP